MCLKCFFSIVQFLLKGDEVSVNERTETVGADKNRLVPTDIGVLVTSFLEQQFEKIMDYQFTARVEEAFDEIAQGKVNLSKLQSMPIPGSTFKYGFYADLEFDNKKQMEKVLEEMKTLTNSLKIFGLYKKGKVVKG